MRFTDIVHNLNGAGNDFAVHSVSVMHHYIILIINLLHENGAAHARELKCILELSGSSSRRAKVFTLSDVTSSRDQKNQHTGEATFRGFQLGMIRLSASFPSRIILVLTCIEF